MCATLQSKPSNSRATPWMDYILSCITASSNDRNRRQSMNMPLPNFNHWSYSSFSCQYAAIKSVWFFRHIYIDGWINKIFGWFGLEHIYARCRYHHLVRSFTKSYYGSEQKLWRRRIKINKRGKTYQFQKPQFTIRLMEHIQFPSSQKLDKLIWIE